MHVNIRFRYPSQEIKASNNSKQNHRYDDRHASFKSQQKYSSISIPSKRQINYLSMKVNQNQNANRESFLRYSCEERLNKMSEIAETPQKSYKQFRKINNLNEVRTIQTKYNESTIKEQQQESIILFQGSHYLNPHFDEQNQKMEEIRTQAGSHISKTQSIYSVERKLFYKESIYHQIQFTIVSKQNSVILVRDSHSKMLFSLYRLQLKFDENLQNKHFISIWKIFKDLEHHIYLTFPFNHTLAQLIENNSINKENCAYQIVKIAKIMSYLYFQGLQIIDIKELKNIVVYSKEKIFLFPYFRKISPKHQQRSKNEIIIDFLAKVKVQMLNLIIEKNNGY